MKKVVSQLKRTLSVVLAFMMVATSVPQVANTVFADELPEDQVNFTVSMNSAYEDISADVKVSVSGNEVTPVDGKYSVSSNVVEAVEVSADVDYDTAKYENVKVTMSISDNPLTPVEGKENTFKANEVAQLVEGAEVVVAITADEIPYPTLDALEVKQSVHADRALVGVKTTSDLFSYKFADKDYGYKVNLEYKANGEAKSASYDVIDGKSWYTFTLKKVSENTVFSDIVATAEITDASEASIAYVEKSIDDITLKTDLVYETKFKKITKIDTVINTKNVLDTKTGKSYIGTNKKVNVAMVTFNTGVSANTIDESNVEIVNKATGDTIKSGDWNVETYTEGQNCYVSVMPTNLYVDEADNVTYTMTIKADQVEGKDPATAKVDFKVTYAAETDSDNKLTVSYPGQRIFKKDGKAATGKAATAMFAGKKVKAIYTLDTSFTEGGVSANQMNVKDMIEINKSNGQIKVGKKYEIPAKWDNVYVRVSANQVNYPDRKADDIYIEISRTEIGSEVKQVALTGISANGSEVVVDPTTIKTVISANDSSKKYKVVALNNTKAVGATISENDIVKPDYFTFKSNNPKNAPITACGEISVAVAGNYTFTVTPVDGTKFAKGVVNTVKIKVDYEQISLNDIQAHVNVGNETVSVSANGAKISFNGSPVQAINTHLFLEGKDISNYNLDVKVSNSNVITKYANGSMKFQLKPGQKTAVVTIKDKANKDNKANTISFTITSNNYAATKDAAKLNKLSVSKNSPNKLYAGAYKNGQKLAFDLNGSNLSYKKDKKTVKDDISANSVLKFEADPVAAAKDKKGGYTALAKAISSNTITVDKDGFATLAIKPNMSIAAGSYKYYVTVLDKDQKEISAPKAITIKVEKTKVFKNVPKVKTAKVVSSNTTGLKVDFALQAAKNNERQYIEVVSVSNNSVKQKDGSISYNGFTEAFNFTVSADGKEVVATAKNPELAAEKANATGYITVKTNTGYYAAGQYYGTQYVKLKVNFTVSKTR